MSNQKVVVRKNIDNLSAAELAALRNGYRKMQALKDDRGFNSIAGIHGVPQNKCHTDDQLFLPWHRAYLHWFENHLKDHDLNLAVPWWKWTSVTSYQNMIPKAFSEEKTPDGQPNPLFNSQIQVNQPNLPPVNRPTQRFGKNPSTLPSLTNVPLSNPVAEVLKKPSFLEFSSGLEQVHNRIHNWFLDGDMSLLAYAAYDPIFFSHHCMIDRIWSIWQTKNGINNIPPNLLGKVLLPFKLTVADVLDISKLGYEYMVDQVVSQPVQKN